MSNEKNASRHYTCSLSALIGEGACEMKGPTCLKIKYFKIPTCSQCIISVHERVYCVVHGDEPATARDQFSCCKGTLLLHFYPSKNTHFATETELIKHNLLEILLKTGKLTVFAHQIGFEMKPKH